MLPSRTYPGLDHDAGAGMSPTAKIIRDAQSFGLIEPGETCKGWPVHRLEALWEKVGAEWERYGFRVAAMPGDLRARYLALQAEATARARARGWSGEAELAADE